MKRLIVKILNSKDTIDDKISAVEAFEEDLGGNNYGNIVKYSKPDMRLETDEAIILYETALINERPEKLLGLSPDLIVIYDKCVNERIKQQVLLPLSYRNNGEIVEINSYEVLK